MAEYPGADRSGLSPNRSRRLGKVKLFIVHHYASRQDPESAWRRFNTSNDRSVSPNYQVNADGSVFEVVPPDHWRAWTTGSVDHQAVTCETQNVSLAPEWGISPESREAIAHLIVWASERYGFPIQRGRVSGTSKSSVVEVPGIVGHNETPAGRRTSTACPGPSMDVAGLIERARQIAAGDPVIVTEPERDIDMRTIYNTENTDDETRRAAVGELTFQVQGPSASRRERKLWEKPVAVTNEEWAGILATVNARRAQVNLPPLKGVRGEVPVFN